MPTQFADSNGMHIPRRKDWSPSPKLYNRRIPFYDFEIDKVSRLAQAMARTEAARQTAITKLEEQEAARQAAEEARRQAAEGER